MFCLQRQSSKSLRNQCAYLQTSQTLHSYTPNYHPYISYNTSFAHVLCLTDRWTPNLPYAYQARLERHQHSQQLNLSLQYCPIYLMSTIGYAIYRNVHSGYIHLFRRSFSVFTRLAARTLQRDKGVYLHNFNLFPQGWSRIIWLSRVSLIGNSDSIVSMHKNWCISFSKLKLCDSVVWLTHVFNEIRICTIMSLATRAFLEISLSSHIIFV